MGQTRDAVEAYVSASQRALARGDQTESEKLADKALKLEPNNAAALIVRARSYSLQGDLAKAAQLLQQVPDLEKGGEQTELLLDFHLKNSSWDQAVTLALQVFEADPKNYGPLQKVVEALLEAGQTQKAMGILEQSRIPLIDAGEHEAVGKMLNALADRMPSRIEPLEWLVELYGDRKSTRLNSSHRCISYAVFCLKKKRKIATKKNSHLKAPTLYTRYAHSEYSQAHASWTVREN